MSHACQYIFRGSFGQIRCSHQNNFVPRLFLSITTTSPCLSHHEFLIEWHRVDFFVSFNSFWYQDRFLNRFFYNSFFQLLWVQMMRQLTICVGISIFCPLNAHFFGPAKEIKHLLGNLKRINSLKKELPTHNSHEKRLKESILQLSTPESVPLYFWSPHHWVKVIIR